MSKKRWRRGKGKEERKGKERGREELPSNALLF